MPKPGAQAPTPSRELRWFTDRENQQEVFRRHLSAHQEPPVLVFYGVGGAGKTWLLRKLRAQVPDGIPVAVLDFDRERGGRRLVLDPVAALQEIRHQLGKESPRFDLGYAMLRHKQGAVEEPNAWLVELVAELTGCLIPGAGTILKGLSKALLKRIKGTGFDAFLSRQTANSLIAELRRAPSQEIGDRLLDYLAEDLREALATHLNKAVRAVVFLDTFEAVGSDLQNDEHRRQQEKWIRDLAAKFDFALTVIAGQNRVDWDRAEPEWANQLDQHLVGGLSVTDARRFLAACQIDSTPLQDSILATANDGDGGHHCFSLGLCADIVFSERKNGVETTSQSIRLSHGNWEELARRFLKSLASDAQRLWIGRLSLTPRFDECAAKQAFSEQTSIEQDAVWRALPDYSFVIRISGQDGWFAIRSQMRRAMENQPSAREQVERDHRFWQQFWAARSSDRFDTGAALAWYHSYCLSPEEALADWKKLSEEARTAVPARMGEHFDLINWWNPVNLVKNSLPIEEEAKALVTVAFELQNALLGNISQSLRRAIGYYEMALKVYTGKLFPNYWARAQLCLGAAWADLPTGDLGENLRRAIAHYESALRVLSMQDYPERWASTQNQLGIAFCKLPIGNREDNLRRAIEHYDAAIRVYTELDFPETWARIQNNLGLAWSDVSTSEPEESLRRSIHHYEGALRVLSEQVSPGTWAAVQKNLGSVWRRMPTGNRGENLLRSIECGRAALRVYTEEDFPRSRAGTQNNLANAWCMMPTGDREENLRCAIRCYEEGLRVYSKEDFPDEWAMTQSNLGNAWRGIPAGDRGENLRKAAECYNGALQIYTEEDFPLEFARTQHNLGRAWNDVRDGRRKERLLCVIACYEGALRVFSDQNLPEEQSVVKEELRKAYEALKQLSG